MVLNKFLFRQDLEPQRPCSIIEYFDLNFDINVEQTLSDTKSVGHHQQIQFFFKVDFTSQIVYITDTIIVMPYAFVLM